MLWVTRRCIRVNRTATGWLVRRFVDPAATFRFIDPAEVALVERSDRAIGFDAPGARYPHKDGRGRCSFEALVDEYRPADRALMALARIVHDADFPGDVVSQPTRRRPIAFDVISLLAGPGAPADVPVAEAVGLRAISSGFPLVSADDHETLQRAAFLYDALYASLAERPALKR
jgi:hypothetical protein